MQFSGEDLERMKAEMAEAHASIADVEAQLNELSASVVSKDRLISATVDAQGVISSLKLTGQSWREMSAKELSSKIIDVVTQAQEEVRQRSTELFAGVTPAGVDPMGAPAEGFDMEAMMQTLVAQFGEVTREQ